MAKNNKRKRSGTQILFLNRWLSKIIVIFTICILVDLVFFCLLQYGINLLIDLPDWLNDMDHPKSYIGIRNVLPDPEQIREYPVIRWIYLGMAVVLLISNGCMVYRMRVAYSEDTLNQGQKGDSQWTTNKEIKQQYKAIPDRDKNFPGRGGMIISRMGKKLYIDESPANNLIIGLTRSGKGEMFAVPSVDVYSRAEIQASMVILDPKMEHYKMSRRTLERRGYLVYFLNLDDPLHSMGYNSLEVVVEEYLKKHFAEAELLAQSLSYSFFHPDKPTGNEEFWNDLAASLLTALILAHIEDCTKEDERINGIRFRNWKKKRETWETLKEEEKERIREKCRQKDGKDLVTDPEIQSLPSEVAFKYLEENRKKINFYSIINTFTELARKQNPKNPNLTALDTYFNQRPMLDRAKMKYASAEIAGDRTKTSIFTTMMNKMTIFTYENVAKMTAESSLKLEDVGFGEKPVAVFIGTPDYDQSLHFLATAFIRQLVFTLEKRATRSKSGKCDRPVKFICDEIGNFPPIENMRNIITVCPGRDITFDLYIQDIVQMKKLYGDDWETIKGNCGNHIYILSNNDNTAEEFSKNLGSETILSAQRSGNKLGIDKNFMEIPEERRLLNMNQLQELRQGECVVKRVMKRTDLKGRPIRPTPIFNSIDSGKRMLFRHEYLTDTFPDPDGIDIHDVNTEDRSDIDHRERVWDFQISFQQIMEETRGTARKEQRLKDLANAETIRDLLRKYLADPEWDMIKDMDISISRLIDLVEKSSMKETEKRSAVSLIELSAA